jgi:hypothetical protein
MKINEQDSNQPSTVEEAEEAGYTLDRPRDYSSDKYDMIKVEGFKMYRRKSQESTDTSAPESDSSAPESNSSAPESDSSDPESSRYTPTPGSGGSLEVSESYFCTKCDNGQSIEECDQNMGDSVFGNCSSFDRRAIASEMSSRLRYEGLPTIAMKSLKEQNKKLYFQGEARDQVTKKDFELKKGEIDGKLTWMFLDEDGEWKDFFTSYHLNETFLKNKSGLKILLEKYRRN